MGKVSYVTPLGTLHLRAYKNMLVYCNWDTEDCNRKLLKIDANISDDRMASDEEVMENTIKQLEEYFQGVRQEFQLPVNFIGTLFQKKVWENLSKIKYGETATYARVAEQMGHPDAVRAVARACGANPLAIIVPCHRVVAARGRVGGYTGGLEKKEALLELERRGRSEK